MSTRLAPIPDVPARLPVGHAAFLQMLKEAVEVLSGSHPKAAALRRAATVQELEDALSFTQSGTGTVKRTVNARLLDFCDSPKNYNGVGDGLFDDTAAWTAAIANGASVIDGGGLTWRITEPLTGIGSNTKIQNAVFDFSTLAVTAGVDKCFDIGGTKGSAVALTADTDLGEATVTVGDTSTFVADGLVWLQSTTVWDASTSTYYGQFSRVKSVDSGTQLTLYSAVLLDFTTADSASISPITPVSNVTFENVTIIGRQSDTQAGIYVAYGENIKIVGCSFKDIDYVSVAFWRCVSSTVHDCDARFIRRAGSAYGYSIWGGCYNCKVTASTGEDCRHTVTIGDNDGINIFSKVIGCHAISSKDAGFDSHSASMYTDFIGNTVEMSSARFLTSSHDGLIIQGQHAKFISNTVIGAKGQGIYYQPLFQNGYKTSVIIDSNIVQCDDLGYVGGSSASGIYVNSFATGGNNYGASIDSCVITKNRIGGGDDNDVAFYQIRVEATAENSTINNLIIKGNSSISPAKSFSLFVRAAGESSKIENIILNSNSFKTAGTRCIYFAADGASSEINNIIGGRNIIDGGSTSSILFSGTDGAISNIRLGPNIYLNDTLKIAIAGTTDYHFEDAKFVAPTTVTDATVTVSVFSDHYIFNRAGTVTVTLPSASDCLGRSLYFKTIQAQAVVSASSNVVPVASDSAGTAILASTDGAWALLKSDGTNWVIMQAG